MVPLTSTVNDTVGNHQEVKDCIDPWRSVSRRFRLRAKSLVSVVLRIGAQRRLAVAESDIKRGDQCSSRAAVDTHLFPYSHFVVECSGGIGIDGSW